MFYFVLIVMCAIQHSSSKPSLWNDNNSPLQHLDVEADSLVRDPYPFDLVTRTQWGARTPKDKQPLSTPVPYAVIHHSYKPEACYSRPDCDKAMRAMQDFHMDDRGWWDIGYNFAVGSDGAVYEGRGWEILGAHSKGFNKLSIGICLIGDWTETSPPAQQLNTTLSLIGSGVKLGFIETGYKLVGHRQVRDTDCPGDALYDVIKKWDHYCPHPSKLA